MATNTNNSVGEPLGAMDNGTRGCECHQGLMLPLLDECQWSIGTRAVLYLVGLLYSFFGIAIAADVFMCAIERITSQTRMVKVKHSERTVEVDLEDPDGTKDVREVLVWNPTVANLTLMALGSSAPEILLSLIEIIGKHFKAGELGPSTIVGSGAFNLLVITAICIASVPSPGSKRISQTTVFAITATFSILAYIWLLLIIKVITPEVVDIWEAFVTLMLSVVLVALGYVADKGVFARWLLGAGHGKVLPVEPAEDAVAKQLTEYQGPSNGYGILEPDIDLKKRSVSRAQTESTLGLQYLDIERRVAQNYPGVSAETLARLTATEIDADRPHSRMFYRIAATRWLSGARGNLNHRHATVIQSDVAGGKGRPMTAMSSLSVGATSAVPFSKLSIIEFAANKYAASETQGTIRLKLVRSGRTNKRVLFKYETLDGTAKADLDYVAHSETLVFNPAETEKLITVQLLTRADRDPEEIFYVKVGLEDFADGYTLIGANSVATVSITNSDKEIKLQFVQFALAVKENVGVARIPVTRRGNTKERVSVQWNTVDGTAHNGYDFYGGSGHLAFDVGEIEKHIDIAIIDDKDFEKHESFEVHLFNPSAPAVLSSKKKRCVVTILNDDEMTLLLTQSEKLVCQQLQLLQPGSASWRQQFVRAVNVNGSEIEDATFVDYLIHVITFGWKLLFAFVPPPVILGGWLTFLVSLCLIGLLTAVVGDLATIFGCLVGLRASVTAITFVAMGTSMPDLFASKLAAIHEKTADNAIGNITGSNAVNVFLGLGISWFVAAVYWSTKDGGEFRVPAGNLSFSVIVYTVMALLCIALLIARRKVTPVFGGGELGGYRIPKYMCSGILILLWLIYVLLSTLKSYDLIMAE